MGKYKVSAYTGANVSIMVGPHLLTQCAALVWDESQSKRPIYGYASQYFDAVATGTYLVTGQLVLNFISSNYLPVLLRRYWEFQTYVKNSLQRGEDIISYLNTSTRTGALIDVVREILDPPLGISDNKYTYGRVMDLQGTLPHTTVDTEVRSFLAGTDEDGIPLDVRQVPESNRYNQNLNMSNSQRIRSLDSALNYIFENEDVRKDLVSFFTSGIVVGSSLDANGTSTMILPARDLSSAVERNLSGTFLQQPLADLARVDQFTTGTTPKGIDITVTFGPPFSGLEQNQVYNYQETTSFVLRDVHFLGSAGQITNGDSPIMETYNFFARKKETQAVSNIANSNPTP